MITKNSKAHGVLFNNNIIVNNIYNRETHDVVLYEYKDFEEFAKTFYADSVENKFMDCVHRIYYNGTYIKKSIVLGSILLRTFGILFSVLSLTQLLIVFRESGRLKSNSLSFASKFFSFSLTKLSFKLLPLLTHNELAILNLTLSDFHT